MCSYVVCVLIGAQLMHAWKHLSLYINPSRPDVNISSTYLFYALLHQAVAICICIVLYSY